MSVFVFPVFFYQTHNNAGYKKESANSSSLLMLVNAACLSFLKAHYVASLLEHVCMHLRSFAHIGAVLCYYHYYYVLFFMCCAD